MLYEKSLTILLAMLFLCVGVAWAQTTITGSVVTQEDGEPIMGATIRIVGTQQGTVTDDNGRFSLLVPNSNADLQVSYLGYVTQTVRARNGMTVTLVSDDNLLDEVVVTALGIKRSAKAIGYSATQVLGDEIAQARTNDIMTSLAGKVAGVSISSTSSDPGSSNAVIIRGISSLSGSNQPLYVIDGVPMVNTAVFSNNGLDDGYDFGNGASVVNPDDVENMTVLKGAAATALYGSRAANGVILITTKSGSKQTKGLGIEYNGGLQWKKCCVCRNSKTTSVWVGMVTIPRLRTVHGVRNSTAPSFVTE